MAWKAPRFIVLAVLAVVTLALVTGCASTKGISKIKKMQSVAIVEIAMNDEPQWYGEKDDEGGGLLSAGVNVVKNVAKGKSAGEALQSAVHSTENIIEESIKIIVADLQTIGSFSVAEGAAVSSHPSYQKLKAGPAPKTLVYPHGYKPVAFKGSAAKELSSGLPADGFLKLFINFQKLMHTGVEQNGVVTGIATISALFFDAGGKQIWSASQSVKADHTIPIIASVYDHDKMDALLLESVANTSKKLVEKLKEKL